MTCAETLLGVPAVISGPDMGAAEDIWVPPNAISRDTGKSFFIPPLMNLR